MHPSFGIEFACTSTKWEDVMKGPSQAAVLAHTSKILHYRSLFASAGIARPADAATPAAMEPVSAPADRPAERFASAA
jgi:hypothetical protein